MRPFSGDGRPTIVGSIESTQNDDNTFEPQDIQNIRDFQETAANPTRSLFYIVVLTMVIGGLQLAWSTEFSEATPFLLSLGLSKQVLALVWLAGPLSGTIGQPIVGLLSDRCDFFWGRRRIFIMIGLFSTLISLLLLAHSRDIVKLFVHTNDETKINLDTIPFAFLDVYVLDFSIAVIQASARALIVDVTPTSQQQIANAWAARMIGIFNIFGFYFGSTNLPRMFPYFGNTQFKVLSIIVSIMMFCITLFCCWYIKEKNPQEDIMIQLQRKQQIQRLRDNGIDAEQAKELIVQTKFFFTGIWSSFKGLPLQVKIICYTEFFAWVGYFPMLFYTSSYVGELYLYEKGYDNPEGIPPDIKQDLIDKSTRRGTLALLVNSIVTFLVDMFCPYVIEKLTNRIKWFRKVSLKNLWILSHLVFILGMLATFTVYSSVPAIILFGILGFPWGCAIWIPFALISEELGRINDIRRIQVLHDQIKSSTENHDNLSPGGPQSMTSPSNGSYLGLSSSTEMCEKNEIYFTPSLIDYYSNLEHDSGIILAIHNVFVSAPQMLSSVASSFLFKIFQNENGFDSSLAWVFRFGGLVAIGAFVLSLQVYTPEQLYLEDRKRVGD